MKSILKHATAFFLLTFIGFSGSNAQTDIIDEGDGGVVCECNNNNKCVASGGGAMCWNGSKCWKGDGNCRD